MKKGMKEGRKGVKEERREGGRERKERKNEKKEKERKRRARNIGLTIFQDSDLSRFKKILGIGINFREIFKIFKCIACIENYCPRSVVLELKVHMNSRGKLLKYKF